MAACLLGLLFVESYGIEYDRIEIVVNDRAITKNEIELAVFKELRRQKLASANGTETKEIRGKVVKRLIDEALLVSRADELHIFVSDEKIDGSIDFFLRRNKLTQAAFSEILDREKITLSHYRKDIENRLKRDRVIAREVRSKIDISEERLREMYGSRLEEYAEVRARHILKIVPADASKEQEEKVRQELIWIADRIRKGESFEAMADKYSDDPSVSNNHGDLGYFKREEIVREVADAAFRLPLNEIGPPVRSSFGYHLIEVVDKKKKTKRPFEEMRDELRREAVRQEYPQKLETYLGGLRERASIAFK